MVAAEKPRVIAQRYRRSKGLGNRMVELVRIGHQAKENPDSYQSRANLRM